ncbi:MAG: divalent metal cation transporter [Gemmatimonadales bacterium]
MAAGKQAARRVTQAGHWVARGPQLVRRFWEALGPGVITGAADDDPSGIATYSVAGAQFGMGLLWTACLTWPLMAAVQTMCARIGMVTGRGLMAGLRKKFPRRVLIAVAAALLAANTINIGADLSGMADAAELLTGVNSHLWVVIFGVGIGVATIRLRYGVIARVLKWLALVLFVYVIDAFHIGPPWGLVLRAGFVPSWPQGATGWATLVAILGTTISPYLFFWQASQEVEEEKALGRHSLVARRGATSTELLRRKFDVGIGTFFSNLVMFFIILTTALTLHQHGLTNLETSKQVAQALEPLAGRYATLLYTAGIIGTGLLAIPTLSGSAAYALAETFGCRQGIDSDFKHAPAFYAVVAVAMGLGMAMDFAQVSPVKALYWTAVINGLLAPFLFGGNPARCVRPSPDAGAAELAPGPYSGRPHNGGDVRRRDRHVRALAAGASRYPRYAPYLMARRRPQSRIIGQSSPAWRYPMKTFDPGPPRSTGLAGRESYPPHHLPDAEGPLAFQRRVPRVAAAIAVLLGLAVQLGWALDITTLKSILPFLSSMKPNTSACFIVAGIGLWYSATLKAGPLRTWVASFCAVVVGLVGLLTSAQYALGRDLGIDRLLWLESPGTPGTSSPGHMGLNTAIAFALLAAAMLAKQRPTPRVLRLGDACSGAVFLLALVALLGYAYSVWSLTGIASYTQMAVHTAVAFLALSIGMVALAPWGPAMSLAASSGPGGMLLRRLLPSYSLILVLVGWLRLLGQTAGLYGLHAGLAGLVATNIILFGAATVWTAVAIDRIAVQRQKAELALRRASEQLTQVIASSPAILYTLRVKGNTLVPAWISDNITSILGYNVTEALEPDWWATHLHPDDRAAMTAGVPSLLNAGHLTLEYRWLRKDGVVLWIRDQARVVRDTDGQVQQIVGAWMDVTERHVVEEQLLQAQKMESIGRLAGGVAHDFNNLLTVITATIDLVLEDLREGDPCRPDLLEIRRAAERAATLTRQLLAFSRKQIFEPRVLNLNALLPGTETMLRRLIGENIALVIAPADPLGNVRADPAQLEQVIMNLVVNSRDAMPKGGTLTIETGNVVLDEEYARKHATVTPGDYVMLAVSDTGMGMNSATCQRAFEPFFTTKGPDRGTGLGLSTVYGIVKQSGGNIWLYSEPGVGTTFKIYLPLVIEQVSEVSVAPVAGPARGTETILLVEDDPSLRQVVKRTLEAAGYAVVAAGTPWEALQIAERHDGPIHLLLTDIVMPEIQGPEMAALLTHARPGMRVLYMSGYSEHTITHNGILDPSTHLLSKPFEIAALGRKVRQVLDADA